MSFLFAFPFATLSSAAFYLLLFAFAFQPARSAIAPFFTHPVPPHQHYLRGFDTLRGIAAAMVAIGHCWWATYPIFASSQLAAPWLGYVTKWVSIFAVLSGFLIYRSCLSSIRSTSALRDYVVRRFFRIYPVYLLGILLCLALGQYGGNANASPVSFFFSDLFMFPVLSWPAGFANPPTWSLYVEVAFYAALPLALLVVGRRRVVAFCLIAIAAMVLADNPSRIFALWKYFFFGIIASELSPSLSRRSALVCLTTGLALFFVDFGGPSFDWAAEIGLGAKHLDGQTLGLGLGVALLLAALPNLDALGRALNVLPLRVLGVISYSLYVTQFFYIYACVPELGLFTHWGTQAMSQHFSQMPSYPGWYLPLVFFPGAIFWAALSFLVVERPGMKLGRFLLQGPMRTHPSAAPADVTFKEPGYRNAMTPEDSSAGGGES